MAQNESQSPETEKCLICQYELDTSGSDFVPTSCRRCGKTYHLFCVRLWLRGVGGLTYCPNCRTQAAEAFPDVSAASPQGTDAGSIDIDSNRMDETLTIDHRSDLARRLMTGGIGPAERQWLSDYETDERIYYLLNYFLPWQPGWRTTPEISLMIQEFRQGRSSLDQIPSRESTFEERLGRIPPEAQDSFLEVLSLFPRIEHIHFRPAAPRTGNQPMVFLYRELDNETFNRMWSMGQLRGQFKQLVRLARAVVRRMPEESLKAWIIEKSDIPRHPLYQRRYIQIVPATWNFNVRDNTYHGPRGFDRDRILQQVHNVMAATCLRDPPIPWEATLMSDLDRTRRLLAANASRPDLDDIPF